MLSLKDLKRERVLPLPRIKVVVSLSSLRVAYCADLVAIIHRHVDPLGPIEMPLSSLASGSPTAAAPSVSVYNLDLVTHL
jgi:hypothetical protein